MSLSERQAELIGKIYGGWRVTGAIDRLHVLSVEQGGQTAVLKLPRSTEPWAWKTMKRFRSEVQGLRTLGQRPGILPLIDFGKTRQGIPWFVMPYAEPLAVHLGKTPNLRDVIEAAADLATTLASLHADGLTHRDIKPANLFWLSGKPVFGDFGIAAWADRERLTRTGEAMGSAHFLAPEARQTNDRTDYKAADIWALAKSIHVLANPEQGPYPPGGTHHPGVAVFSMQLAGDSAAEELEQLMEACTALSPGARPTAAELASELKVWLTQHPSGTVKRYKYAPSSGRPMFRRLGDAEARAEMLRYRQTVEFLRRQLSQTAYSLGLDRDDALDDTAPLLSMASKYIADDGEYYGPDVGPIVATKPNAAGQRAVFGSLLWDKTVVLLTEIQECEPESEEVRLVDVLESDDVNPEFPSGREALFQLAEWAATHLGVERARPFTEDDIDAILGNTEAP